MFGNRSVLWGLVFAMLCTCSASGTDAELSFVYEKAVRLVPVRSQEFSEAAKDRNLTLRYSRSNPQWAWVSEKTAVKDEKHLLELLGAADGDVRNLSNDKKSLLELFRFSKTDTMKSYLAGMGEEGNLPNCQPPGCVTVTLADASAFSKDQVKKDYGIQLRRDFWAWSTGTGVFIGSAYDSGLSLGNPKATLIHEFSHCVDAASRSGLEYGLDGTHFGNEKTNGQTALIEGWAEYNEMLSFGMEALNRRLDTSLIKEESGQATGTYRYSIPGISKISGLDLLSVEAVDAVILYRLAKEIPQGQERVKAAFIATNQGNRDMAVFLRAFVAANPGYEGTVAKILDQETKGKLNRSDFTILLGSEAASDSYFENGRKSLWAKIKGFRSSIGALLAKGWDSLKNLFRNDEANSPSVAAVPPIMADPAQNACGNHSSPVPVRMAGTTPFGD